MSNHLIHRFIADGDASHNLSVLLDPQGVLVAIDGSYTGGWASDEANQRLTEGLNLICERLNLKGAKASMTARQIRNAVVAANPDDKYQDQLLSAIADAQDSVMAARLSKFGKVKS